ncbi:MAG TPA: TIGR03752 family integrating conjugative element protein, partial [Leucothrix sp.]|nr:TIGR03752 family integrating conjugative element protein [Leucothrix sp.]
DQLETQHSKMSAMESAVNTQTLDASNLKDEIMQGLRDNFSRLMPEGVAVPDPNAKDYPVSIETLIPKKSTNSTTRVRSYDLQKKKDEQSVNDTESDSLKGSSNHFLKTGTAPQKLPSGSAYRYPEKTVNKRADRYANDRPDNGLSAPPEITVDPRFTIPPDAVLNDSVTITALVGRIPRDGDVSDPAPFKVAIGGENLAANGFSIPGIDGMIMSGYVYGDAVRKCVYTKIKRATYIFEDGRILSLPNQNSRQKNSVIGYLTDPYGDPCIKGRYLTNSNAQIKNSIFANMAAGAANAFAATQTTTLTNGQGGASTAVTGDPKKYILGSAISTGASSVANYLLKQSFDQWDQVVVPVGQTVTIHIDVPLELDNQSTLRKLVYGNETYHNGLTD